MAVITQEIKVEVAKKNLFPALIAKQYDYNSRFLKATLCDNGVPITINPTSTVTINANRPDGTCKRFPGVSNDDDTVTVPLDAWMLQLAGVVYCDISVTKPGESMLTSTSFSVDVEPAAAFEEDKDEGRTLNITTECNQVSSYCSVSLYINGEKQYTTPESSSSSVNYTNTYEGVTEAYLVLEGYGYSEYDASTTVNGVRIWSTTPTVGSRYDLLALDTDTITISTNMCD